MKSYFDISYLMFMFVECVFMVTKLEARTVAVMTEGEKEEGWVVDYRGFTLSQFHFVNAS